MFEYDKPLIFVDLETTGTSANFNRIIEVAAIQFTKGQPNKTYTTLVNPECRVPEFILQMTGINQDDLDQAPLFSDIVNELLLFCENRLFVAHNARFDYGFMKSEITRSGHSFSAKTLCTVKLARKLYPDLRRHSLSFLVEYFGLNMQNRHRALDDTQAVIDFLNIACNEKGLDFVQEHINDLTVNRIASSSIPSEVLKALPEACGVYTFYDDAGNILYIGKSTNIKERVHSHFYADSNSSKELKLTSEARQVDYILTGGELSALLLEAELIKDKSPRLNVLLKSRLNMVYATSSTNQKGYFLLEFKGIEGLEQEKQSDVLGVFRGLKQAKKVISERSREWGLCDKLLSLESTGESCFRKGLGTCFGACVNEEPANEYNERFRQAFADLALQHWPFKGAVLLEEKVASNDLRQAFVVNNWHLQAKITGQDDNTQVTLLNKPFEWNTYLILNRYLSNKSNKLKIHPLSQSVLKSLLDNHEEELEV